ncbi:MAG: pyridoxal phosphate-dependent aminotransferase [Alphaproteobacteria bacterium]|nr:pyridoxal phosphate-dependent aminotransferase [Alphaproteobacteria bacterium]
MSGGPALAGRLGTLQGTVYSNLVARFGALQGDTFPLHVGDTWLRPPEGCRTEDVHHADVPDVNRYTPVPGWPPLLEALRARVEARTGVPVGPEEVHVAPGATAAIAQAVGAMLDPGAELLILAPAWPLVAGACRAWGGVPVHVPFLGQVQGPADVAPLLDRHRTPRTVGLYVNTPNNPTGQVIDRAVLEAVVAWARAHDLRILSDEVYEDLQFEGTHTYVRSLAPERTVSAWSFSKGFGMAGNRCGYVAGPADVVGGIRKLATYTTYCAPFVAQVAALRALGPVGEAWVADARQRYAELGAACAERLGVPAPAGGTFLFLDLRALGCADAPDRFLERCVERGVLLAPGTVFGPYPHHVRLCFTAVAPERTRRGVEIVAELLGR